jgi:hypothetical protein
MLVDLVRQPAIERPGFSSQELAEVLSGLDWLGIGNIYMFRKYEHGAGCCTRRHS